MFNVAELAVIVVVALIVLGPKQLPTIAYQCGRLIKLINRLRQQFSEEFTKQAELGYNQARAKTTEASSASDDRAN